VPFASNHARTQANGRPIARSAAGVLCASHHAKTQVSGRSIARSVEAAPYASSHVKMQAGGRSIALSATEASYAPTSSASCVLSSNAEVTSVPPVPLVPTSRHVLRNYRSLPFSMNGVVKGKFLAFAGTSRIRALILFNAGNIASTSLSNCQYKRLSKRSTSLATSTTICVASC